MTEANSIVSDPNVAVEFIRKIFPPEAQQSMGGRADYKIFCEGVQREVKGLYSSYEIGMRLRTVRKEIEQKNGRIQDLKRYAEKAESELRKAKVVTTQSVGQTNLVMMERVNQCLLDHAIANWDMESMFAKEEIRTWAYEQGFF